jgi:mannose-6-phosphate isomerase-like protein (cupin superfamily)
MARGPPSIWAKGSSSIAMSSRSTGGVLATGPADPLAGADASALDPEDGLAVDGGGVEQPTTTTAATSAHATEARERRGIVGMYARGGRAVPAVLASPLVEAYEVYDVLLELTASGRLYQEFLRTHDLSVGLYRLPAGGKDPQGPHTEDEVYHVIRGRAAITVGDEEQPVGPGSIVFVGADVPHRFHDIEDELVVLVIFGPAEYTHRVDHQRGVPHGAAPG